MEAVPRPHREQPNPTQPNGIQPGRAWLPRVISSAVVFSGAFLTVLAAFFFLRTTPIGLGNANAISVPADFTFCIVQGDSHGQVVEIPLTNIGSADFRVVGVGASCSCVKPQNVPLNLRAGEKASLRLSVEHHRKLNFHKEVRIYTEPAGNPITNQLIARSGDGDPEGANPTRRCFRPSFPLPITRPGLPLSVHARVLRLTKRRLLEILSFCKPGFLMAPTAHRIR